MKVLERIWAFMGQVLSDELKILPSGAAHNWSAAIAIIEMGTEELGLAAYLENF